MKIFLLLLLSHLISFSNETPSCCLDPTYFPELLSFLLCDKTCTITDEHAESLCIICLQKALKSYLSLDNFNSTKPVILCQSLKWMNNTASGNVVLKWSTDYIETPLVFIIEARTSNLDSWDIVGFTNESVALIDNLNVNYEYQFRVMPFVVPGLLLPSIVSNWTMVLGTKNSISAPLNVTTKNFRLQNNSVELTVEWSASLDIPCSYVIYWFPSSFDGPFGEKTVEQPDENLSTVLSGLSFKTKYILKVAAFDSSHSHQVHFATASFITPSCLELTNGNFSLCAPGPPLNFTVWTLPDLKAFLSWLPPKHSSPNNQVSGYRISVIEASEKHYILLRPKESFTVSKDVLNVTLPNLRSQVLYLFHVRAFTAMGIGPPAVAQSETTALSLNYKAIDYVPWHYIVPSLVFALTVILIAVLYHLFQHRQKVVAKNKGYPSGTADIPDHVLPSLLPSRFIDLQEVIGKGEFGVVYKATYCRKKEKETVAVKVFPAESISRSKLLQEVEILLTVGRHQNVVSLIGFTMDIDKMFLVLEYCSLGNLHDWLLKLRKELSFLKKEKSDPKQPLIENYKSEPYGLRLCSYIHQIALGMNHISLLHLIHRDLAARNILLCSEKHIKIADFGLSRDVYFSQSYTVSKQKKLPVRWMAPESMDKHNFTTQTDVWSFGVVIWEIFKFGKVPYSKLSNSRILPFLKSGHRLPKPNATSQCWYDLMLECWHIDPEKRPTFQELVQKTESILSRYLSRYSNYTAVVAE